MDMNTVILSIQVMLTLILAGAAVWSAKSAKKSAKAAEGAIKGYEKTVDLQVIAQILDEFSSDGMQKCLRVLWNATNTVEKLKKLVEDYKNAWATENFEMIDDEVEAARRRIAWHFTRIYILKKREILKDDLIKELVTEKQIKGILIKKIKPLEQPNGKEVRGEEVRGEEVYKFFENLIGTGKEGKGGVSVK